MQTTVKTVGTKGLLGRLDKDIKRIEQEIEVQQHYLNGLRAARMDISGAILNRASQPNGDSPRATVLKEVLEVAPGPMPMDDIVGELRKRGLPPVPRANVHATLSYLSRKGIAKRVDRGVWTAVTSIAA